MRVLSFGAGVQTVALLHLAIEGEIPKPDVVLFADTQAEPTAIVGKGGVLERSRRYAEEAGIRFEHLTAGDLKDFEANNSVHAPLHFEHLDGRDGLLQRTCTARFKIEPVRYRARDLGATRYDPAQMLLGITLDEAATRMSDSQVRYVKHQYPLVDLGWTRSTAEAYVIERGFAPIKSACVMCPLTPAGRLPSQWRDPDDVDMAMAYDRRVRTAIPGHPDLYVRRDRLPVERFGEDSQLSLFGTDCADAVCGT